MCYWNISDLYCSSCPIVNTFLSEKNNIKKNSDKNNFILKIGMENLIFFILFTYCDYELIN